MNKNTVWDGEDIYLAYGDKVLMIAEGSGDNLLEDDIENGYVDYFNLELYKASEFDFNKIGTLDTIGGGFMMRTAMIRDEFYGLPVEKIIAAVFEENGHEDAFNLYSDSLPAEYEILNEEKEIPDEYRQALSKESREHLEALEEKYGRDVLKKKPWFYNNDIEKVSYPVEMHDVSGNPDMIHASSGTDDEFFELFTSFSPEPVYKTQFLKELTGELGEKFKKWAESKMRAVAHDFERENILLDKNGAAFWKESGTYIHPDVCEVLLYGCHDFSILNCDATKVARTKQFAGKEN